MCPLVRQAEQAEEVGEVEAEEDCNFSLAPTQKKMKLQVCEYCEYECGVFWQIGGVSA